MIGQTLDRRYRVVRSLETGGFGQTFIAEDTRRPGNPICVVKHLQPASSDPDFLQVARRLFHREAETLEKLGHHDQIPRLLAFFEQDQEFYLVQEFVEGNALSTELGTGKRWSQARAIAMLKELLGILEFIHSKDVIHRDIKPDNIIRRRSDCKLFLVDFGAVKQVRTQILGLAPPVHSTVVVGTPGYMPSEQGQGQPRPCSDLYALGMIAIQALTGISPSQLEQDEDGELMWQDQAHVSDAFAAFLTKMVRYYFKLRFQTAREALHALTQIEHVVPTSPIAQKSCSPDLEQIEYSARLPRHSLMSVELTQAVVPNGSSVQRPPPRQKKNSGFLHKVFAMAGVGVLTVALGAMALTVWGPQINTLIPSPLFKNAPDQGIAILEQAQSEANTSGNLGNAIQLAKAVSRNSSAYGDAQSLIQRWQLQWQRQNALFQRAQAAFKDGRWSTAKDLAYQLPRNPYWDARANPIYFQAKRRIAEIEQQAQPSPSPVPTETPAENSGPPEENSDTPTDEGQPSAAEMPGLKTIPAPDATPGATPGVSPAPQVEDGAPLKSPVLLPPPSLSNHEQKEPMDSVTPDLSHSV